MEMERCHAWLSVHCRKAFPPLAPSLGPQSSHSFCEATSYQSLLPSEPSREVQSRLHISQKNSRLHLDPPSWVEKLSSSNIPCAVMKLLLGPQPHLETRWLHLSLSLFVLWPQLACEDHNGDVSRNPALTHLPTTP